MSIIVFEKAGIESFCWLVLFTNIINVLVEIMIHTHIPYILIYIHIQ